MKVFIGMCFTKTFNENVLRFHNIFNKSIIILYWISSFYTIKFPSHLKNLVPCVGNFVLYKFSIHMIRNSIIFLALLMLGSVFEFTSLLASQRADDSVTNYDDSSIASAPPKWIVLEVWQDKCFLNCTKHWLKVNSGFESIYCSAQVQVNRNTIIVISLGYSHFVEP